MTGAVFAPRPASAESGDSCSRGYIEDCDPERRRSAEEAARMASPKGNGSCSDPNFIGPCQESPEQRQAREAREAAERQAAEARAAAERERQAQRDQAVKNLAGDAREGGDDRKSPAASTSLGDPRFNDNLANQVLGGMGNTDMQNIGAGEGRLGEGAGQDGPDVDPQTGVPNRAYAAPNGAIPAAEQLAASQGWQDFIGAHKGLRATHATIQSYRGRGTQADAADGEVSGPFPVIRTRFNDRRSGKQWDNLDETLPSEVEARPNWVGTARATGA